MKSLVTKFALVTAVTVVTSSAMAEVMDRPVGIKIGEHMTLKPYVSASATYDTNVDSSHEGQEDIIWTVNPGLGLEYKAESWLLLANVFYQYNAYSKNDNASQDSYHGFGEDVTYRWTDSMPNERGWTLMLTEKYQKLNQNEDMNTSDGRGYGRDREEFNVAGGVQRRFTDRFHGDVNGSYYGLDYDNSGAYQSMYGWSRWTAGAEIGYAFSSWTDLLLAGSYSGYTQDNNRNRNTATNYRLSGESQGCSVQAGLGSWATERIQYRLLGGWSRFNYGGSNGKTTDGFVYTATGNWKITDTWNTMLLASSYYQPSEREYSTAQRTDMVSWGLAHSMIRNKLSATLDASFRRETHEYSADDSSKYDLNVFTARIGLNYVLNRYMTFFGNVEYRKSVPVGGDDSRGDSFDYDRLRTMIGVRFTY